jgi:hypothetical protein
MGHGRDTHPPPLELDELEVLAAPLDEVLAALLVEVPAPVPVEVLVELPALALVDVAGFPPAPEVTGPASCEGPHATIRLETASEERDAGRSFTIDLQG